MGTYDISSVPIFFIKSEFAMISLRLSLGKSVCTHICMLSALFLYTPPTITVFIDPLWGALALVGIAYQIKKSSFSHEGSTPQHTPAQALETKASQLVVHTTTYNNHTTVTAKNGNTIVISPHVNSLAADTSPSTPVQTVQQPHSHNRAALHTETRGVLPGAECLAAFYKDNYGKIWLGTAIAGYVCILYHINTLQRYLTDTKRIGMWFSEYDLNRLLLIEFDRMHDLLIQEFITMYQVSDQKILKSATAAFLHDMETELRYLEQYKKLSDRIGTVSSIVSKLCSPWYDITRTLVPFSGFVLDHMPSVTINNIFFVDNVLKSTVQDRISRIHYYKNIFLQANIVI